MTTDGQATLHPLPTSAAGPVGITKGTDGAMWFVEINAGQIGCLTQDGHIRAFPLPERDSRPHAITPAPEGGCWFTEWGANSRTSRLGRHRPVTTRPQASPTNTVTDDGVVRRAGIRKYRLAHRDPAEQLLS